MPRHGFERLAAQHHRGGARRRMSRWSQLVALAVAQLAGRHSLRDLELTLQAQRPRLYHLGVRVPARASLAGVDAEQPHSWYEALCGQLLGRGAALARRHRSRFRHKLDVLDSSFLGGSLSVLPWATCKSTKAATKLHVGLDLDDGAGRLVGHSGP